MSAWPAPIRRLDVVFESVRIAHEAATSSHWEVVATGGDSGESQRLLAESASIALNEVGALLAPAQALAQRWEDEAVLDPGAARRTLTELDAELDQLTPAVLTIRSRHVAIVREIRALISD